ncbi:MAG: hypothetical protein ACYTF6_08635 [Planctomycetota bacterium]|jgi:hypothetical protein
MAQAVAPAWQATCGKMLGDGKEHTIAVRVRNSGIDEPVCLIASDESLDADQLFRLAKRQTRKDRLLTE